VAGPKRPQDRIALNDLKQSFAATFARPVNQGGFGKDEAALSGDPITVLQDDQSISLQHGSVLIAAITSCTNTSNPGVMLAAGLVAKKAVERGLTVNPAVKASLAPGSRVVSDYLSKTGLQTYLDQLGFNLVGYGCTTCIGNSGPLSKPIEDAVVGHDLVAASVLSGNRNFEARVHQNIKANFLMSPPLVVALALAGRVDIDLAREPIGMDSTDQPVFLKDLWPSLEEIRVLFSQAMDPAVFQKLYSDFADQNPKWNDITSSTGNVYQWDEQSTYIQEPPFFSDFSMEAGSIQSIEGARALGVFGDSVTTDHISPAGAIKPDAPAGKFLESNQVAVSDFNSYGSRRGNDRIMTRGTFANVRIKNLMVPGVEGGVTCHQPSGEQLSIYDAAQRYAEASTPLVVLAGHEYGTGSSRDWAAKGTRLLGVKAVVAASFERIHRSNLVGMGVLPLQFEEGETIQSHQLDGSETYDLLGLSDSLKPRQKVVMKVTRSSGQTLEISLRCRIDTDIEIEYYRHGGILPYVLRQLTAGH
jgi:aconitate hydratase